jgi:SNF2 family DNA or RNA helicase
MQLTDYHAKYYAHELTKRCSSDSLEKLAASLADAQVDLNPHQVDAALFAFRSPLSRGAILADEVGLGKTIEAGIVLSQIWAERKRKILIIVPSSLRKQWNQELLEKFFFTSIIFESKSFNQHLKNVGAHCNAPAVNPFEQNKIIITSYQFARNKADQVKAVKWDLVVIDEAHRLRNVYKTSNKIARAIKEALADTPKLLLTATPLQNSLMELYGLVGFIDDYIFGDIKSYKNQFARLTNEINFDELKSRIAPICKRTLRRQVLEYIKYTNRIPITQEFVPTEEEAVLYDLVSEYLRRDNLQALPASQRSLMTLVLRKLLASSTFAIAGALDSIVNRLKAKLKNAELQVPVEEELANDFETLDEIKDEWEDDEVEERLTKEGCRWSLLRKKII